MQVLSLPIWQLGVKYRFKAGDMNADLVKIGFGLGITISNEATQYSILDDINVNDSLTTKRSFNRLKAAVGLSAYF